MKTKDEIKYKERKEKAITEGKRYVYVGCFGDYTYEDLKNSKFFNLGNKKETIKIFGKPREGQYDFYKCFTDKNGTCLKDENGKETYEEITEQEYNDILMLIRC